MFDEVGTVLQVGDGVARVRAFQLYGCGASGVPLNGVMGMALNLEEDNVGGTFWHDTLSARAIPLSVQDVVLVPVGNEMLGRVVNPLGIAIDGGALTPKGKFIPI